MYSTIGKYEIVRMLGRGAMGEVYEGRDPVLGRSAAIKIISPTLLEDADIAQRFIQEARAAATLSHRNIVVIYECGEHGGMPFIAMECLEGFDLRDLVREPEFFFEARLDVVRQLCDGLGHAHQRGIVHRDIKPANVRVLPDGTVKIVDFGIARLAHGSQTRTQTGAVLGTAAYMSPEQCQSSKVTSQSDIWSAGVILYELATGSRPFEDESAFSVMQKIVGREPDPLIHHLPDCPPELERIMSRALAKDLEARYSRAGEMARDLWSLQQKLAAGQAVVPSGVTATERVVGSPPPPPEWRLREPEGGSPHPEEDLPPTVPIEDPRTSSETWDRRAKRYLGWVALGLVLAAGGSFAAYRFLSHSGDGSAAPRPPGQGTVQESLPESSRTHQPSDERLGGPSTQQASPFSSDQGRSAGTSEPRSSPGSPQGVSATDPPEAEHDARPTAPTSPSLRTRERKLTALIHRVLSNPPYAETYRQRLGQAAAEEGVSPKELRQLESDVQERWKKAQPHFQEGVGFARGGFYPEAVRALEEARKQDGESVLILANLGQVYMRTGKSAAALTTARQARDLDPEHWLVHYGLAVVYASQGKASESVQALSSALDCAEKSPGMSRAQLLENMNSDPDLMSVRDRQDFRILEGKTEK